MVNHGDGHEHVEKVSKGRTPSEQPEDEAQTTEEFRSNGQNCECSRNVQNSGEEAHRAGKAVSTDPPQRLLGAVGEKDHSQRQSKNSRCNVIVGRNQFTKHRNSLRPKLPAPTSANSR